jgi:hypothetical protein
MFAPGAPLPQARSRALGRAAHWTVRARWPLLGAAAVVLIAHSLAYNFVTDDAYISFVFARNFAEHGQLAFNLGQPVEGYTNFLWTFALGIAMWFGAAPEWSSRVLGAACALATLYLVFRITARALGRTTPWAALPALLLACSSGFACWTSGGLETQLYTLLITAALDALVAAARSPRALRRIGIVLALAAMTRPEGPLVAAVLGLAWLATRLIGWLARDRSPNRADPASPPGDGRGTEQPRRAVRLDHELVALAWLIGLWAPWFAWRWWYYGWPFPNTYYVKATGAWSSPALAHEMTQNGLYYVWLWLRQSQLIYVLPLAVLGLVAARPRTPRFALTVNSAVFAAVYLGYAVAVGGDFMGLHRFILPLFVVAALCVTLGAEWLARGPLHRIASRALGEQRGPAVDRAIGLGLGALLVGGFAATQLALTRESLRADRLASDHGIDSPAFLTVYTEDRAAIGRAMQPCFRPDDFSIVGGAGAQPYFGRMRGIDVFGLVSETIAHGEPRIRARAGHTKFGSDRVLAAYDPTFVFSCYQIHAGPEQPALPCAAFWLARGFEPVTMHIPGMRERGEYYTFLARADRMFHCPGRVH